eukprot:CAMPEP_0172681066 /NCGR_PEP_ID=MMETSP1074-20121228/17196_1 /TAXON_ID=2916 /ORGANISM="Ceratium fusus, Strain PA161109" /LENGTH=176 /DNA_ID=CAMNT_0013499511 /DNA_START=52 /DNA_END=579 /DNA_ORIENTATION=+
MSVPCMGDMVASTCWDLIATGLAFGEAAASLFSSDGVVVSTHLNFAAIGFGGAAVSFLTGTGVVLFTPSDIGVTGLGAATVSLLSGADSVMSTHPDPVVTSLPLAFGQEDGGRHPGIKGMPVSSHCRLHSLRVARNVVGRFSASANESLSDSAPLDPSTQRFLFDRTIRSCCMRPL